MELRLSEVLEDNEKFRFDPEYFKKEYLEKINTLKYFGYDIIDNMAFVTDGIHESIDFDSNSNINLISAKSPKENVFDLSSNDYISSQQHQKNPRTELKKEDVIVSTVGTIGNCAVVDNKILPANSDRHVGIIRLNNGFKPHVLSTFILSKYGRFQTFRESTGNVQLNLFIYKIKTLKIPNYSELFQKKIEFIVEDAHKKLEQSKTLYKQAENLLLKELDLLDFEPSSDKVAIKTFSESFGESGRLDSEYYQVKYDEIIGKIKSYKDGYESIREVLTEDIRSGTTPKTIIKKYIGNSNYFFRAEAFNDDLTVTYENLYSMDEQTYSEYPNISVKQNDILVSMTGTIGNVAIVDKQINGIINQNIVKLSVNEKLIKYFVLALYMKTVGKILLTREQTGNVQPYVNIPNFSNLIVPLFEMKSQIKIEEKIKESFKLKEESKALLDLAKRAVEVAIEEGEDVAMGMMG